MNLVIKNYKRTYIAAIVQLLRVPNWRLQFYNSSQASEKKAFFPPLSTSLPLSQTKENYSSTNVLQ